MIAYLDIEVNAAAPQMPLGPCVAFVGSPSNVRILNVPKRIGSWKIDAVAVAFTRPDNSITTLNAVNVAGCWVATLPASDVSGRCDKGFQIEASGTDENGNAVTGYVLGVGDTVILPRDGTAVSDGVQYYFHYRDAVPTTPRKGDVCVIDGALKWYNGSAWQAFGAEVEIVAPSTDPADAGKAADAYAAGTAIATKCTQAEAVSASVAEMTAVTPAVVGWQWPETITFNGVVYYYAPSANWILENDEREKKFYVVDVSGESIPYPVYINDVNMWYAVFGTYEFGEDPEAEVPETYQWHPAGAFDAADPDSSADATTLTMAFGADGLQTYTLTYANEPAHNKHGFARLVDLPAASTATPQMNGTPSAGSSAAFARGDHVHPKDTSKQDAIADLAAIRSGAQAGASAVQPSALAGAVRYDLVTITTGQLQDRAVQKMTLNAASTTLVLPALTDLTGKVSDFGIDMVNAYEESDEPAAASFELDGTLGTDYNLIVPKGETWSDMTALAAGEMAVYYFTLSAFAIGGLPTWEVMKKVVELVPVPTAP